MLTCDPRVAVNGRPVSTRYAQLYLVLVGCGVGLGDVQRDVAGCECFEDWTGKVGEAQAPVDETLRQSEALRNRSRIAVFFDKMLERLAFLSRRHLQSLEVLRQRDLARIVFAAIDDEARYFEVRVHGAPLDDAVHGPHPLPAAYHLEAAALFRLGDDEVLQHAARLDIEGQSLLEFGIGPLADIVFALIELAQRDELHDRIS